MSYSNLPPDARKKILTYLNQDELLVSRLVNKQFSEDAKDDRLWLDRIIEKFGLTLEQINEYRRDENRGRWNKIIRSFWEYYRWLSTQTRGLSPNEILRKGIRLKRMDLINVGIHKGADLAVGLSDSVKYEDTNLVRYFLTHPGPGIITMKSLCNDLFVAIAENNIEIVKMLIEAGTNIHYLNDSALVRAVMHGYKDIVRILIDSGANIAASSALSIAQTYGHTEIVEMLTDALEQYGA